jgi:hypothetical protein
VPTVSVHWPPVLPCSHSQVIVALLSAPRSGAPSRSAISRFLL